MNRISTDEAVEIAGEHQRAGKLPEAESLCRQVLGVNANHAGALHLLGMIAGFQGHLDAGIDLLRRAVVNSPPRAGYFADLGSLLEVRGQPREAIAEYRRALELQPKLIGALSNLGSALRTIGELDESIAVCRQALAVKPDYASALGNLANALNAKGEREEAIEAYLKCISLQPELAISHYNLGNAYQSVNRLDDAIKSYREAIRLLPNFAEAYSNLANALQCTGKLDEALASCRRAIELNPRIAEAHGNIIFTLHFHPDHDRVMIQKELRQWYAQHAEPLKQFIQPHNNDGDPDRRLRLGYVSDDFYHHASALFLLPLFEHHDARQFEIFCYSEHAQEDDITRQMRRLVHQWRSTVGRSDSEVAQMVRADKIDILVDLKVHTAANRLLVFAQKPAPVQVSWLGYPGSTGLITMDYRLTDPYLDPPGLDDASYSEQSVRLPDTFWCYDPLTQGTEVSAPPRSKNGFVTFGCLNSFRKVNHQVLSAWARILQAVNNSKLMMMAPDGSARTLVLERLGKEGIGSDRVSFIPRQARLQYMLAYQQIDIGLDTFPYNGHTTSLDSLWMGVPVVTLLGRTAVGRAGSSLLTNLGMMELIAETIEQYVQIAWALANDAQRLSEIRSSLRGRMEASPLMDAARFAGHMESAFRKMWHKWCTSTR